MKTNYAACDWQKNECTIIKKLLKNSHIEILMDYFDTPVSFSKNAGNKNTVLFIMIHIRTIAERSNENRGD